MNTLEQAIERAKAVHELAQTISAALDGKPHSQGIEALVSLALVMAKHHTCCTESTARAFALAAGHLNAHMAQSPMSYPLAGAGDTPRTTH